MNEKFAHTPGRLVFSEDGLEELKNQNQILETESGELVLYFKFHNREDARRLAACWNACEGMGIESIEELSTIGGVPRLIVCCDDVRRELDELIDILARITEFLEPMRFDRASDDAKALALGKIAISAIQKATGKTSEAT